MLYACHILFAIDKKVNISRVAASCNTNKVKSATSKELRNFILRIICLWSLFCSIQVYASQHFLPILLEASFFVYQCFLFSIVED